MRQLVTLISASVLGLGLWFVPQPAAAQDSGNGECSGGLCGTPDQSGGGCGCGCGSILVAMTDRGDTYQFADDFDGDGIEDNFDNCPFTFNYEQLDSDGDAVGDSCDSCPSASNPLQENADGDAQGDACDTDLDNDGILNNVDNCPAIFNAAQTNTDGANDGGDACDTDDDNDGILDVNDACRLQPGTTVSAACDDDPDGDGINTNVDNCPTVANPQLDANFLQLDADGDGMGDLCDPDMDGDGIQNFQDNCASIANPSQVDMDRDGLGDAGNWGSGQVESCDDTECYVVTGDQACLNPNEAFDVRLALVLNAGNEILVGDQVTVALFSNRFDVAHQWTARFNALPNDSRSIMDNAEGSGSTLNGFPQVANCIQQNADGTCAEFNQISFVPDSAGTYEIQVTVNLPNGDPDGLGQDTRVATIIAEVGGGAQGGCAAGSSSVLAALALGLLAAIRRRRR